MPTNAGYHLQARRFAGRLSGPTVNDARSAEQAGLDEALTLARRWAAEGFTVWVFDHGRASPFPQASDLRLVQTVAPSGLSSRTASAAPAP